MELEREDEQSNGLWQNLKSSSEALDFEGISGAYQHRQLHRTIQLLSCFPKQKVEFKAPEHEILRLKLYAAEELNKKMILK